MFQQHPLKGDGTMNQNTLYNIMSHTHTHTRAHTGRPNEIREYMMKGELKKGLKIERGEEMTEENRFGSHDLALAV